MLPGLVLDRSKTLTFGGVTENGKCGVKWDGQRTFDDNPTLIVHGSEKSQ
jgi:hypothetical protein